MALRHQQVQNLDTQQKPQKADKLKKRRAIFTKAASQSEAAMKAIVVAEEIRPFTEGEFVKQRGA